MTNTTVAAVAAIEAKIGVPSLESLHAERDRIVNELVKLAPLEAKYGPANRHDEFRSQLKSALAVEERAKAAERNVKITEAAAEDAAKANDKYKSFLDLAMVEHIHYIERRTRLRGDLDNVEEQIRNRELMVRAWIAEAGLAR